MVAVMEGNVTAVRILLEGGADVHQQTKGGDTALRLAELQEDECPDIALLLRQTTAS
jgi:ankyrin repeat protein